ncbi:MAG: non-homologous end-joining DNA ligase [Bacteroidota bacterium]
MSTLIALLSWCCLEGLWINNILDKTNFGEVIYATLTSPGGIVYFNLVAKQSQFVQVEKRKLELSNLTKLLYTDTEISKAEIIHYYLSLAPTILTHVKGRPLSLVRYPDGVGGETFFQKNRPEWAPDWLEHIELGGDKKKDYMLATEAASLVWLANLACLEVHQMHSKRPNFDSPDYIVYDLDPPEGYDFQGVVNLAIALKEHIENYGYSVFVKTTGGKGVHLLTPILPKWSFEEVFQTARIVARAFVEKWVETTLHIKKEARKGRVLIDIYRNRSGQTIIAPYSLRGTDEAPVSMPLRWDELVKVVDPKIYCISNVKERVLTAGDAWEGFASYAVPIHTDRKNQSMVSLSANPKRKTPEQLDDYEKKRDFKKTPEPSGLFQGGDDSGFVVHRHHASHLHYDLRLEESGVLKSWAVPRGLPPKPGIKRLAVATEDHPMKYITFEGEIPKSEYGGGKMWIYANGKYTITKKKKDGFYFTLSSKQVNGEYRMHLMKDKEWLLERVDHPQTDYTTATVAPMLAGSARKVPLGTNYSYEMKWDGIRVFIVIDEGEINIWSRNHKNLNQQFPELMVRDKAFRANSGLFDGEIVCFDKDGKPDFKAVIHRMQRTSEMEIERVLKSYPAYCYLFDCLYLDGRALINEPLSRRREWLNDSVRRDTPYRISQPISEGPEFFEAVKQQDLEGIIAKDNNSKYYPGKRSESWIKVKVRNTADAYIIGYTLGVGNRENTFGALHLGNLDGDKIVYRGKVGTGFTDNGLEEVWIELKDIPSINKPIQESVLNEKKSRWIAPLLTCEIEYASITKNNTFREPVFIRLLPMQ